MNSLPRVKRLFWDIETAPNIVLAFQTGYNLTINPDAVIHERKIICIGFKWEGEKKVTVLRWSKDQDDKQLIMQFLKVAEQADELVAHYGDHFDAPFVAGRCLIHKLPPFPQFKTVDTKAWASKNFFFNSNKLDYLSKVLGYGGKEKMEFDDWKKILMNNCKKSLNKMCHYCGVDVEKLEKVYADLAKYVKPKTHAGVAVGLDKWTCPRDGSTNVRINKKRISANGSISYTFQCLTCGSYYTVSATAHKAFIKAHEKPVSKIRLTPAKRNSRR